MEEKADEPQVLACHRNVCFRCIVAFTGNKETAEVVSGLIMQGAAVVAYIIGEGLADAAAVNNTLIVKHDVEEE